MFPCIFSIPGWILWLMGSSWTGWLSSLLTITKISFYGILTLDFKIPFFWSEAAYFRDHYPFASIKTFKKIFWVPSFWSLCVEWPTEVPLPVPFCENSSVAIETSRSLLCSLCCLATPTKQFWPTRVSTSTYMEDSSHRSFFEAK